MENFEEGLTKKRKTPEKKKIRTTEVKREKRRDAFRKLFEGTDERTERDFSEEWRREEYLAGGIEFLVDVKDKNIDTMVFMDKSARPLAGFFHAVWKRIWPDVRPPEMKFMVGSRYEVGYTTEDVARAFVFTKNSFENKNVLLVDEEVVEGTTLVNAKRSLEGAFPNAKFLLGGMNSWGGMRLDISPPYTGSRLGKVLHGKTKEIGEIEERRRDRKLGSVVYTPTKVHGVATHDIPVTKTYSFLLRQIGKHEVVTKRSLSIMDKRIAEEKDIDKKSRLLQIREAYEKLME